jgi:hypothetical protein
VAASHSCGERLAATLEEYWSAQYLKSEQKPTPGVRRDPVKMANFWKPAAALPFLLAGCYRYVPVEDTRLAPATPVSIELSAQGTRSVASRIGSNVVVVEGNVTEASPSSLTLALMSVRRRGENSVSTWSGESLTLAREEIDQVSRKELSPRRTAVASVALGAASVGLVVAIAKATGAASGSAGGKPSPNP